MPKKVEDAVKALKSAEAAVSEILHRNYISISGNYFSVGVLSIRDLEQIPGELEYIDRNDDECPVKARKVFEGVEFHYLMTPEEARSITELVASA